MAAIQSNYELKLAEEFLKSTGANLFLTGRAGTGKTTFLHTTLESINKRYLIAAPTGVAALNARGVTLHSLFQLPFSPFIPTTTEETPQPIKREKPKFNNKIGRNKLALIRSLELLVIDEISMVRCDVLDAVDATLRRIRRNEKPFGGVQLLMIGDIQQLSPICKEDEWQLLSEHYPTPYFFNSKALNKTNYVTIELKQIFRQKDPKFTAILNAVRDNKLTQEIIGRLNSRYVANFTQKKDEGYITLTTHNHSANNINSSQLQSLKTQSKYYKATITGDFPQISYPNDTNLELKVGSQVIFIKNDISPAKLYYNGMIAKVLYLGNESIMVQPKDGGDEIEVKVATWENIEYTLDKESGEIIESIKGTYSQMPLKCAWAITIHKSQGLSFDKAIIDANSSFAHGQVYVALSRCRTLEGMVLKSPITLSSIVKDYNVEAFCNQKNSNSPNSEGLELHKRLYFCDILCEIFNFNTLRIRIFTLSKILNVNLIRQYPQLAENFANVVRIFDEQILKVGETFQKQLINAVKESEDYKNSAFIKERLNKAATYFSAKIAPIESYIVQAQRVNPDAKEIKKRVTDLQKELTEEIEIKMMALTLCAGSFTTEEYLKRKIKLITEGVTKQKKGTKSITDSTSSSRVKEENLPADIINPKLYAELAQWRKEEALEINKPAYIVLSNRAIIEIQSQLPTTLSELKNISGIGAKKLELYGEDIITIVKDYCYKNNL